MHRAHALQSGALGAQDAAALEAYADHLAATRQQVLAQMQQRGISTQVHHEYDHLFNGFALSIHMRDWGRLADLPQVKAIYVDHEMRASLADSVLLIGAPFVWQLSDGEGKAVTGEGVRVAILDTGVDYMHPDLGSGFGPAYKVVAGYDFVNLDDDPMDDNWHGTHVAGIVAASGTITGVAPGASLMAYKVLDASGVGDVSNIIAGLERAADPDDDPATDDGAHVINLSLGGWGNPDDPLCQAVDNAVAQGIVVVVAAGNGGSRYRSLGSPGVARRALTVGASDIADSLADFSSRGPIAGFPDVIKPDITAPGVAISSTLPLTHWEPYSGRQTGTSMAAPHVAGAAALVRQLHPDWTAEMIKANLMNTARDLGWAVYDQGAGRVDLPRASSRR